MRLLITDPDGNQQALDVPDGTCTLGGLAADALRVEGLLRECARLSRDGGRLMLEPLVAGVSVNDVRSPLGVPRLVEGNDRVALPGRFVATLVSESPGSRSKTTGTASLLRDFLADRTQVGSSTVPSLLCLTGLDVGKRFALTEPQLTIGRGDDAAVRIRERSVSRRHARLTRAADGVTVEDLASPNGVSVNAARIAGPQRLTDGDVLELGNALLRVCIPAVPQVSACAAPPSDAPKVADTGPAAEESSWSEPPQAISAEDELVTEEDLETAAAAARPRRSAAWPIAIGCVLTIAGGITTYGIVFAK